ncbi:MAG: BMC domain-containing protein [Chitinivibrionales bacterium]|nr:BMC domain-containing protein [Chitinivibrionales bacterium]
MKKAIGMIETVGFIPMVEAVDAVTKAAPVNFLRWETAGSGMVTAFFDGDVAAVKAAIDLGAEAAGRLGKVVAAQVIPNPSDELALFYAPAKGSKASL